MDGPLPGRRAAAAVRTFSMHLVHAPGLIEHGSKPARDLAAGLVKHDDLARAYRGFDDALVYAPHQVCIGNLSPDDLAARPRQDFPWLAREYLEGRLKLDELITQRLPLEQINDGFAGMAKGAVVRAVLTLN